MCLVTGHGRLHGFSGSQHEHVRPRGFAVTDTEPGNFVGSNTEPCRLNLRLLEALLPDMSLEASILIMSNTQ